MGSIFPDTCGRIPGDHPREWEALHEPDKPEKSYKFDELDWHEDNEMPIESGSWQAKMFFDNGYGISVVFGGLYQTTPKAPYEVAIFKGIESEYEVDHRSGVQSAVIPNCTKEDVEKHINEISRKDRANEIQ